MTELRPLHEAATGFKLFRGANGDPRDYTAVEFTNGWAGANRFLNQLRICGYVRNPSSTTSGYGVLDVLNGDGDIVADYDVPTSHGFAFIKRKLGLVVDATDPTGFPQPTIGQWKTLDWAVRYGKGYATNHTGRGAYRPLPSLIARGWCQTEVTKYLGAMLTSTGRAVARGWAIGEDGELHPANRCERCAEISVGQCCFSHRKNLCHGCYRITHFVAVCVATCPECAAEGLPLIYPPRKVQEGTSRG